MIRWPEIILKHLNYLNYTFVTNSLAYQHNSFVVEHQSLFCIKETPTIPRNFEPSWKWHKRNLITLIIWMNGQMMPIFLRRLDPRSFRRAERVRPSRPGPQPDMVVPERCHLKIDDAPNDDLLLETGRNPAAVKEKHWTTHPWMPTSWHPPTSDAWQRERLDEARRITLSQLRCN